MLVRQDKSQFGWSYQVWIEQEPGRGGKESAGNTNRRLAGHRVFADRVTGKKELRAEPYAAQAQNGNVYLIAREWHADFFDEHESFPNGRREKQVDPCVGAFAKLAMATTYNLHALAS